MNIGYKLHSILYWFCYILVWNYYIILTFSMPVSQKTYDMKITDKATRALFRL